MEFGGFSGRCCPGFGASDFGPHLSFYDDMLVEVGSLRFHEDAQHVSTPILPPFITTVSPRNVSRYGIDDLGDAVGVRYSQVPKLLGTSGWGKQGLRTRLRSRDKTVVLTGADKDGRLETVFVESCKSIFWDRVRALGPVVCISPDYSLFHIHAQCRETQLLNMKRSLHFCIRARREGIPCALSIAWSDPADIPRWCKYLVDQGAHIDCLAVNVQTSKGFSKVVAPRLAEIEALAGREFRWIVQGPSCEQSYLAILDHLPTSRVTIMSARPQIDAAKGQYRNKQFPGPRDERLILALNHADACYQVDLAGWGYGTLKRSDRLEEATVVEELKDSFDQPSLFD